MPTAPMRRIYTPYAPGIQPTWSVSQVRGALTSHELGNFDTSARLAEAMGRDDRLSAVLETRVKGLLGLPFRLDATDQDDEQAKRIAEELDRDWFDMIPEDELAELLRWRILMGFAVASLEWTTEANKWRPRVKVWNPQYPPRMWPCFPLRRGNRVTTSNVAGVTGPLIWCKALPAT